MMKRKDLLKAAFDKQATVSTPVPYPGHAPGDTRVAAGAVRAMGLSLGRLEQDAARAEALASQLANGELVQELDTAVVDPSFVDDRIDRTNDPDYRRLVESISATGQQVPILVRPHPKEPGRYQVAYGHRRLAACTDLQRPVKALVRQLSDAELVVAQGKENAERRNLSFIERATFAAHLEQQGFDRPTMQAALAVHPSELTRLLAVARSIPNEFILAIGAAPRAGRPRWLELAGFLSRPRATDSLRALVAQPSFQGVTSDNRFDLVMASFRPAGTEAAAPTLIRDYHGRVIVKAEPGAGTLRLTFDLSIAPGLDERLLERLPALIETLIEP
jgi:ParB family transcriptional regulator, chromosome partitioning protein